MRLIFLFLALLASAANAAVLSTQGNQIVNEGGQVVRITGVNWFGFETETRVPHGLWVRSYKEYIDQVVSLGFNTLRIPFCNEMLRDGFTDVPTGPYPYQLSPVLNGELVGLTPLEILDEIIAYSGEKNLHVFLDRHSAKPDNFWVEDIWYIPGDTYYTEQRWIGDWVMLADRYKNNSTVIGADLFNEPKNSCVWSAWRIAAQACGNAIHAVNSNWLIIVEGTQEFEGTNYWWGGNLRGVASDPVVLQQANKVVYSIHDYPSSVYTQTWFEAPDYPYNLDDLWRSTWGYLFEQNTAPILVGEFGTFLQSDSDKLWIDKLTDYMDGDFDLNGTRDLVAGKKGISFTYWCLNPDSGDTRGILQDDWITVNEDKMAVLRASLDDVLTGTLEPSVVPTTAIPTTYSTTAIPTTYPTAPTEFPTTGIPTQEPTAEYTARPTSSPTTKPSTAPTAMPSHVPSAEPTIFDCPGPFESYPDCEALIQHTLLNETSAWFVERGLDGSRCGLVQWYSDNGGFCPGEPTALPTVVPTTVRPTTAPTVEVAASTAVPTVALSASPTFSLTNSPTLLPTTTAPTPSVTQLPTDTPVSAPADTDTDTPVSAPADTDTDTDAGSDTDTDTDAPVSAPTNTDTDTDTDGDDCAAPYPAAYPDCDNKVSFAFDIRPDTWFSKRGIERTRCSIQAYYSLPSNGGLCPGLPTDASDAPTEAPIGGDDCAAPYPAAYPDCDNKVSFAFDIRPDAWLAKWGLERERCSIQAYYSLPSNGAVCPSPPV